MAGKTKGRIVIPRDIPGQLSVSELVYQKHLADGASSPLAQLEDNSWAITGPKIAMARSKHEEAEELRAKMEDAYRDRDLLLPEIIAITNASKALLKAKFSKNPKKLGDWGFAVDDTPRRQKPNAGNVAG